MTRDLPPRGGGSPYPPGTAFQLRAGHHPVGDPPGAVARARAVRRGHGQAEDRDRQHLVGAGQLLQPPRRHRRRRSRTRSARPAACRSRCGPRRRATSSPAPGAPGSYILPSRDLIANDIEVAVEGAQLDGMVCLASCDKTDARRSSWPPAGWTSRRSSSAAATSRAATTAASTSTSRTSSSPPGTSPRRDDRRGAARMSGNAVAVSGRACAPAWARRTPCTSPARRSAWRCRAAPRCWPTARAMWAGVGAGRARIVEMVAEGLRPRRSSRRRRSATPSPPCSPISGSVNCDQAPAGGRGRGRAATSTSTACSRSSRRQVPLLTAVRPNGDRRDRGVRGRRRRPGGAAAAARRCSTSTRRRSTGADAAARSLRRGRRPPTRRRDPPVDEPLGAAPGHRRRARHRSPRTAAVVKRTVDDDGARRFTGPAKVFHSRDEALARHPRRARSQPGDVVVLQRPRRLRGSPGMALTSAVVFALDGAGLGDQVAVVTDGQMSGLVNKGLVVGEVSPEAAVGGPLGLVRDGDVITIDVDARTVDLEVPAEEELGRSGGAG